MAASAWYLRKIKTSAIPRWRKDRGAGWVQPALLVCECGATWTFQALVSCGPLCIQCNRDLLPEESLDAAISVIELGGTWEAALTDLCGIPNVDDVGGDRDLDDRKVEG